MIVDRQILVNVLKLAAPALASEKNQVRELYHFWFDGDYLSAFNDILGIRIGFKTEFKGGVNGDHLIGVLENSRSRNIRLDEEDGNLMIKTGAAIIKLALLPVEDLLWRPVIPTENGYPLTKELLSAVDMCLLSVGKAKVLTPEQRGVTLIQNSTSLDCFSTDAVSLSWVKVDNNTPLMEDERCIIPTPFCEQLKNLGPVGAAMSFETNAVYCDSVILVGEVTAPNVRSNDPEFKTQVTAKALLFSKLVEDEDPIDFMSHVNRYLKGKGNFTVPPMMKLSIDRAMVVLAESQPVQLRIGTEDNDNWIFIFAEAEDMHGEVDDAIKLEGKEDNHPDIKVKVDAGVLKRGLDSCRQMMITEDCVVMRGAEGFVYVVATK